MKMKFVVLGAFLLLQVFTVKSQTMVHFYSLLSNSTGNCSEVGYLGVNSLVVTTSSPSVNVTEIDLSNIKNENVNVNTAVVVLTPSASQFSVRVKATADNESKTIDMSFAKESQIIWKNNANGAKLKQIRVNSSNFTGNSTYVSSCFDLGLVYKGPNMTNFITVVTLGCWTWSNKTEGLSYTTSPNIILVPWANEISARVCNGAFSSLHTTPIFALILAVFVSYFNKL